MLAAIRRDRAKDGAAALARFVAGLATMRPGLPVTLAEDPLACVALGTGQMLTDFNLLRKISIE